MYISLTFIHNDPLDSLVIDAKSGQPIYHQVTTELGGGHLKTILLSVGSLSKAEHIPQ